MLAWRIKALMREQHIAKTAMAKRMATSRAAAEWLLDAEDAAVTLQAQYLSNYHEGYRDLEGL